tara:strand:- start:44 stop:907 length:864 start_codon:yes stop_codon:yes gene_type:complete
MLYFCTFTLLHNTQVMGMLIGRPSTDPKNPHAMVVTDAFPLPVEGIETRVEANADAQIAMVELSESIEVTREERIMGWYHSHPFDVQENPMYFFSSTDCQNQVVWQRGEDKHGNPFVGIVIDPLRSLAKGRPEMGSFRAFLPSYSQSTPMSPDGIPVTSANKSEVMERWGATWNRYYLMDTQYFMSDLTKRMVDILAKNFTWISVLSVSLKNDVEYKQQLAHRIGTIAATIGGSGNGGKGKTGGGGASAELPRNELDNANSKAKELGMEQRVGSYTQDIKEGVFAKP